MKVALIGDTHWGVRSDNIALLDYQKKFLDEIFFPYLDTNNIRTVFHLGDLVDRRKYVNINTASRLRVDFLQKIVDRGITLHTIAGNHDCFFKNKNDVNALYELGVDKLPNSKVYIEPAEIELEGTKILLLPWICEENETASLEAVRATKAQVLFGHLELKGFEMYKGTFSEHGYDASVFNKFEVVASGHFHHKSQYQNVYYLGSPFEMTWADYGDTKGFHVFDSSNRGLEFIENPHSLFNKIQYNDVGKTFEEVMSVDFSQYKDTYVKVIVSSKDNPFLYDTFIQKLEESGVLDVQAVDDHLNLSLVVDDDIINQAESTLDILTQTVKQIGIKPEYEQDLEMLLRALYSEASLMQAFKDTLFLNNRGNDQPLYKGRESKWKNMDLFISGGIENTRDIT